jgi:DNA repair protein RadC
LTNSNVHRFVTIEQITRAEQPATADLRTLFDEWGLTRSTQEAFWVIAIDNWLGLKTITEVARGGYHDVVVYPATILAAVLAAQTDRFYVAHNHPSGPVTPTDLDMTTTANILEAANAAGLSFEDHIIVGPSGWFSFWEQGLLIRAESLGIRAALKKGGRTNG